MAINVTREAGAAPSRDPAAPRSGLTVSGVTVAFGGVLALDRASLVVAPGSVTGLIGPNGSGKTTMINVISGIQPCTCDGIWLDNRPIHDLPAYRRPAGGLARTFQAIRLFESLSVMDNVLLGAQHEFGKAGYLGAVFRTPAYRSHVARLRSRAMEILAVFGERLIPRLHDPVSSLSYANRRRTEVCRAAMSSPRVLMLDEPTAGMNPHETEEFARHLVELRDRLSCAALVIEHKMDFVTTICDHVYVLDHGTCIAEGTPEAVIRNPAVVEAYLGAA